jgi:hemerythrin-like domain-containing protein
MNGKLYSFFVSDHRRLELLLNQAASTIEHIDPATYSEFREGLLRHIGIEEKILLPAIKRLQNGLPYYAADTLRVEHGALAALLVPSPNKKIVAAIRAILNHHNGHEECANCLYRVCESLLGSEVDEIMNEVKNYPPVPVAKHVDTPNVLEATRRALARAGFDFDQYRD